MNNNFVLINGPCIQLTPEPTFLFRFIHIVFLKKSSRALIIFRLFVHFMFCFLYIFYMSFCIEICLIQFKNNLKVEKAIDRISHAILTFLEFSVLKFIFIKKHIFIQCHTFITFQHLFETIGRH